MLKKINRKIKLLFILAFTLLLSTGINANVTPKGKLIGGGFILFNDVCYYRANYEKETTKVYLTLGEVIKGRFPNSRVFMIPVPMSQIYLEEIPNFNIALVSQNAVINEFAENINQDVKVINMYTKLREHIDEYLYFKYDTHWTNRGAYYAYQAFMEAIGEEAPALSDYREAVLNTSFKGIAHSYIQDSKISEKRDTLYAYVPNVVNNLKVFNNNNKLLKETTVIDETKLTYAGAFIAGDNPLTIIHADNNKNKSVLVIKDSFGCGFVPHLVNTYSDIFVVDPRYSEFNLITKLKDFNIDDIIVLTGIYNASDVSFLTKLGKLIDEPK